MAEDLEREHDAGSEPDPVGRSSLSGPIVVGAVLLFLSLVWALYDETVGDRPWKAYQQRFLKLYETRLLRLAPEQAAAEKQVRSSAEFVKLSQAVKAAEEAAGPRVTAIDSELASLRAALAGMQAPFQDGRARIAALTYELEHAGSAGARQGLRKDIEEARRRTVRVSLPPLAGAPSKGPAELAFAELEKRFLALKAREAALNAERAEITKSARELRARLNQYLADNVAGLNRQQIDGLLRKVHEYKIEIKQIHVEEAGLVDRCESCHAGIREPVLLTAGNMGGERVFASHPDKDLISIHDPNRFGCSPCHNGNGLAISSVEKAHGNYQHWLWPLFARENSEAGCLQCHFQDRVLGHAAVLNRGRDLFDLRGCAGCHRYEGYDREADALAAVQQEIRRLALQQKDARLESQREIQQGDTAETNELAQQRYAAAEILRVNASNMDAKIEELDREAKFLTQDRKKFGPNLKDVRLKLRKEWIPVWLRDPHEFRPGTKMPKFRLTDAEVRALSAFVWQRSYESPKLSLQPAGDASRGRELFETRGCLGCHSMGEGNALIGGEFAANLSRVGEKANYDYIVRWVHDPRERTRPYCAFEERDLGPEDYARHGKPYAFSLENSACPNDGHELQVQQMTVMPKLRLTWQEAQDIATYLTSLKRPGAGYPSDVSFMDDPRLAETGLALAGRYGCAGCHEIRGLEESQRIGTELTKEGSKPLEQLDFGLLGHPAEREGWYTHKGFFERKLQDPAIFDRGREKAPEDRLRMPTVQLTNEDRRALVTFLLGSMDSPFRGEFRAIPEQFRYLPTDQQKAIQEGWWVIKKYNCMGCHTIQPGQKSVLSGLPRYQDPDWKEQLPPSLYQEGARVSSEWLTRFLENPALSSGETDRNGVRTYLHARMPTFSFSPNELTKLVRFFQASAGQPEIYFPPRLEPLNERELLLARALFSSQAAPCLRCHIYGDPAHDQRATAPNFLIARERLKPAWTARWMLDPQAISPGTAMPSGLFRRDGERWVFSGPTPESFRTYAGDHVQLLVRYMFQLTPEEQRRLVQTIPKTAASANGRAAAPRVATRSAAKSKEGI